MHRRVQVTESRQDASGSAAGKLALEHELQRLDEARPLKERLRPLQDRVMAPPATGREADKAFYDALSGDP